MGNVESFSENHLRLLSNAVDRGEVYEFGPFRLDATGPLLLRDAQPVPLTPKASETLLALVRRAGHVVSKEELIKEVWPDTFVEESNLSNNVWTLRKALEDDGAASRYIETLPKRGYRFVAEVRRVGVDRAAPADDVRRVVDDKPWLLARWHRWLGALGVIVLIGGTYLVLLRARTPAPRAIGALETGVPIGDVTAGKTRVAVLPFENLTQQPDDDWLASAFSDSLTAGLQPLDSLILVSRSGISQAYREHSLRESDALQPEVIERMSRMLNIRYYVHGSYQRMGDHIRVIARLVEIGPGTIKAQESATDRLANLLQLEDELARRFARSLESAAVPPKGQPETTSLAAYRLITEARGLYASGRWQAALESAERAVEFDPKYADAWAQLAKTYARLAAPASFTEGSLEDLRSRALTAAQRAIELDPSSYEAHVALALAHRIAPAAQLGPWRAAAQKAIALNPRSAEAYAVLGDSYSENPASACGRDRDTSRTVAYYRQALRIDPTVRTYYFNLTTHLKFAGRLDEALQVADEGVRMHPTWSRKQAGRFHALIALNRIDEAEHALREYVGNNDPRVDDQINMAAIDLKRGRFDTAANGFRKAVPSWGQFMRYDIARHYLEAGLPTPALDHLEQALRAEPRCAQWLLTTESTYWDDLRANPQTRALLKRYAGRQPL